MSEPHPPQSWESEFWQIVEKYGVGANVELPRKLRDLMRSTLLSQLSSLEEDINRMMKQNSWRPDKSPTKKPYQEALLKVSSLLSKRREDLER